MSITRSCFNCGAEFYPHGGQKFCSDRCRLVYYEYTRPLGKREEKRINAAIVYRERFIENAEQKEVRFDFKRCSKCRNEFAVRTNQMFPMNVKCPFCQSESNRESMNMKYEAVTK